VADKPKDLKGASIASAIASNVESQKVKVDPEVRRDNAFVLEQTESPFTLKGIGTQPLNLKVDGLKHIYTIGGFTPVELKPLNFGVGEVTYPASEFRFVDATTASKSHDLEREIADLKRQRDKQASALKAHKEGSHKQEAKIEELQTTVAKLREKEQLSFLLERVNAAAQRALLGSDEFQQQFLSVAEVPAFVMSIDIRRSTELMLKARRPELFAAFITTLCNDLMKVIKECFGVVDKFTGDGVLAFFPEFFSGPDAGYLVVTAASRAHEVFTQNYRTFRNSFNSVLTDVGLGIGVDYGMLHLVEIAGGLTVVGQPVVYACRLGGCPAGKTSLNQPAYEKISEKFSSNVFVHETELEIKHEGRILAYEVALNQHAHEPQLPQWLEKQATE
jgi:class 3 adenylate cyclase